MRRYIAPPELGSPGAAPVPSSPEDGRASPDTLHTRPSRGTPSQRSRHDHSPQRSRPRGPSHSQGNPAEGPSGGNHTGRVPGHRRAPPRLRRGPHGDSAGWRQRRTHEGDTQGTAGGKDQRAGGERLRRHAGRVPALGITGAVLRGAGRPLRRDAGGQEPGLPAGKGTNAGGDTGADSLLAQVRAEPLDNHGVPLGRR